MHCQYATSIQALYMYVALVPPKDIWFLCYLSRFLQNQQNGHNMLITSVDKPYR